MFCIKFAKSKRGREGRSHSPPHPIPICAFRVGGLGGEPPFPLERADSFFYRFRFITMTAPRLKSKSVAGSGINVTADSLEPSGNAVI